MSSMLDNILPWRKKKELEVPKSEAGVSVADQPAMTAPLKETARTLGELNVSELEQALTRIEVAKKVAEVREQHAGVNRNRVKRLIRTIGVVALGAFFLSFFSSDETKVKLPVNKLPVMGAAVPVSGALPGATRTGRIAVIKVSGGIDGTLHGAPTSSNTPLYLETAFLAAENEPNLAGVILEIDSPGGGASASEQGYRIVKAASERLAKKKVRVIAYTSLGAYSGGYYIAMGVGKGNFFADPGAAVANVGVIMSMFNTAVLGDAFGVTENIIKTGPLKSTGAQWEKLTPDQRAMAQEYVNDSFELFLKAVAHGRGIDFSTLVRESQLPAGRTNGGWFSAKRALDKNLIDGVVPVEDLYKTEASALPDREKFNAVEFVEFRAERGVLEEVSKKTGSSLGAFFRSFLSEMTHRDAPMRSERE